MVMPARVICCPEVPLDERKRGVHHRPSSIALVARRQEPAQEQYDLLSETPQTHRVSGCGDLGHVLYTYTRGGESTNRPAASYSNGNEVASAKPSDDDHHGRTARLRNGAFLAA